ncbi:tRNA wybutosine-synthesizing protein 2-like protein [Apostichopus japonicus]|uniref:tRNA(Phe) (4-demethylwyosine(37)-C(7)) aminocarboxypropyltransferase n=2 Tax=Stichopus japonicus TaxID=307972 RepID=A0A2G8JQN5_STIJA|nr:tRNA wybutosine-synthesizing protein 2-like protein [Apostichopus japonicus]
MKTPHVKLREILRELAEEKEVQWTEDLERDIPRHWEVHGDLILLPDSALQMPEWSSLLEGGWRPVADALGCKRLAQKSRIQSDDYRSPNVKLLFGKDSWVEHIDNRIRYCYDIRHSMFSAGNISEKIRVGSLICQGETVVDLFAGIGYFVLPYLVHAGAKFVHACEWNPHALKALKRNLELNKMKEKCQIHFGDCRKICPRSVADRVNLGLIPSSECSWPVACAALKPSGGTLHIHGNVETHSSEQNTPQEESTTEICASDELYEEDVSVNCSRSGSRFSNSRLEVSAKTEDEEMEGVDSARIGQNVHWVAWARHIKCEIHRLLEEAHGGEWEVKVIHLEHVKSYAPHVDHMVADVSCRPIVWSG